jgi:hypothetical protein
MANNRSFLKAWYNLDIDSERRDNLIKKINKNKGIGEEERNYLIELVNQAYDEVNSSD